MHPEDFKSGCHAVRLNVFVDVVEVRGAQERHVARGRQVWRTCIGGNLPIPMRPEAQARSPGGT
eukprot:scaffold5298_cov187-Pinguiococcus_pyrenoidosus.AAC.2